MRNLLHAEWTKLRTVRGWVGGLLLGAVLIVGFGLLPGAQGSCGTRGPGSECKLPVGPELAAFVATTKFVVDSTNVFVVDCRP